VIFSAPGQAEKKILGDVPLPSSLAIGPYTTQDGM